VKVGTHLKLIGLRSGPKKFFSHGRIDVFFHFE